MKKVTIKSIKPGQTLFGVHALGKSSFLTRYNVIGTPYDETPRFLGKFVKVEVMGNRYGVYSKSMSLGDYNLPPNTYNDHKLFYDRKEAESYLEECLSATHIKNGVMS